MEKMLLGMLMLWLVGTTHASVTCFNKSKKLVKFKRVGLLGGNVNVKANAKVVLKVVPLLSSLLCTCSNEVSGGLSILLDLLLIPNIACVDVGAKVTLYACDKHGNIKGKPLCQPF